MAGLIIQGGMVIDGTGRPPIERGAVLIDGEHISAVGTTEDMGLRPGIRVLDFSHLVLLPGLIDCHNHLSVGLTQEGQPHGLSGGDAELTINATINAVTDLKSGVTTVRCLGDRNFLDIACKKAIESGRINGPRLVVAGKSIRSTHGHGILASPFDGPEEVRRAVRENIKAGANVIKILTSATVRGPGEIHSDYSREEICVAVDEAHRAGLPATAHCIGGIGLEWCLDAGMDSIEHGYFLSDHEIDLLVKYDRWLVLTPGFFLMEDRAQAMPPEMGEGVRRGREEAAQRMAAAIKAGVKFGVGSDAVHGRLNREIECLVELGASEQQAILGATRDGARVCGLGKSIGTLEPGKIADVIGVDGNPLKDIQALRRVDAVICRGKLSCYKGKEMEGFE